MMFYGRNGKFRVPFYTTIILISTANNSNLKKFIRISLFEHIRVVVIFILMIVTYVGLPVPFRQPLRMVTGDIVLVKKNDSPSDEEVNEVLDKVIIAVTKLYETKKPEWEKRPLKIT